MSKTIEAVYENGVFLPLQPVTWPEGKYMLVSVPEVTGEIQRRLAALDAFEGATKDLTEEQWKLYNEAVQRHSWLGGRQLDL